MVTAEPTATALETKHEPMQLFTIQCPYCRRRIPISSIRCPLCRTIIPHECGDEERARIFRYAGIAAAILALGLLVIITGAIAWWFWR